tara:strand:- start:733 stop:1416 length:684 start_codon:yes stop_codon:yes gene_type:complete
MIKSFVCVCTGDKYTPKYVNTLYNMVMRHSTDVKFHVITDSVKAGFDENITQIAVTPLYKSWWNKVHMFRDDIGLEGTVIFMDLDVVILKNIDHLWEFEGDAFVIIQDFNRCRIKNYHVRNSSVMKFHAGNEVDMWHKFNADPGKIQSSYQGDQNYVTAERKHCCIWPYEWIMSYKWELGLMKEDQRRPNDKIRNSAIPQECCVAVFHGKPDPGDIKQDPVIIENWR